VALDTFVRPISVKGGYSCKWTPEEDAVLIKSWQEWVGPSGQARKGFIDHALTLFPHRSRNSLLKRKSRLVRAGTVPRQWQRREYRPVVISDGEAHYLASLLDGEGSIIMHIGQDRRRNTTRVNRAPQVILCYNNNEGILSYVEQLVSCIRRDRTSRPGVDGRGIRTNKAVYALSICGYRAVQDILRRLLPYMHHTDKRRKAEQVLEFVTIRLEIKNAR